MLKEQIINDVNQIKNTIISHRRFLHSHAELGFKLKETKDYVSNQLKNMNYDIIECGQCGLYVEVGHGSPVFLLRADMDALPIQEQTDIDFKSPQNMHACGHDLHTAMMLGAAKILKKYEDQIKGTIRIMFQPSEETFEGALDMIEHGVLKNVSAALMSHVVSGTNFKTGSIIVSDGGVNAPAADVFTIEVKGKSCHGSTPHLGKDALTCAAHILIALQEISARELATSDEAILTIGMLNGGDAPNAICGNVIMKGTLRTFDEQLRATIKERMNEIIAGLSYSLRCESKLTFTSGCPTLKNDEKLSQFVYQNTLELLGKDNVFSSQSLSKKPMRLGGSEDFAYISHLVPSLVLTLNSGHIDDGYTYPLHHPCVKFDEEALVNGCLAYVYNALLYVNQ